MTVTRGTVDARPLRVGLLGLGTVAGAVATQLLDEGWRAHVSRRGLTPPKLVIVGVREPARRRAVEIPNAVERTEDLPALAGRDDIDVVVELLGGLQPARGLIERALEHGKSVITANKMLLAEAGAALEKATRLGGATLRYEAAVAGGIPILGPLARDLAANRVDRVRGIVNGTTNFILSAMHEAGSDYGDALADAQRRGYAEAEPAADVEGRDAAHKLVLLARLAFGTWLEPSALLRTPGTLHGEGVPGISGVTRAVVRAAAERGLAIKLVASAALVEAAGSGDRLVGWVEPCAVPGRSTIGATDGVMNVVEVRGQPLGRVAIRGPGAGGDATSSAVLGDILALARGEGSTWAALPEAQAAATVDDGRSQPARWFHVSAEGRGVVTEVQPLEAVRRQLRDDGAAFDTTIYRLLEDD